MTPPEDYDGPTCDRCDEPSEPGHDLCPPCEDGVRLQPLDRPRDGKPAPTPPHGNTTW